MNDQHPRDSLVTQVDLRQAREDYDAFVARALEHHERTGEWLPDPLLDEIDEARRRIKARHGDDYRNVLDWYVHFGKQHAAQNGNGVKPASPRMEEGL